MANFYTDNEDIKFLFQHLDLKELAALIEQDFTFASEFDHAPADGDTAVQNYQMVLDSVGQLSGDFIAPRSEGIDREHL